VLEGVKDSEGLIDLEGFDIKKVLKATGKH
jgi:hypothetical protein